MGGRCTIVWGDDLQDGKTIKKILIGLRRPPFSGNTQQQIGVAEVRGKLVMTSMTTNCAKRRNKINDNGGGDKQMIRVMVW